MSYVPKLILNEFYEREKTDKKMIKNLWKDDNAMAKNETYTSFTIIRGTQKKKKIGNLRCPIRVGRSCST